MATIVFLLVYLGMMLGDFPRLRLDRTGIALLGAIALLAAGTLSLDAAVRAIDIPTLALLFGLMVVSAQLRMSGFYTRAARTLGDLGVGPRGFLAVLMGGSALFSAVFSNDIVCLAVTPVLIDVCDRRRLDPIPFLIALAAASNIGSAATLIGNPQNMLIGQRLALSFPGYLAVAGPITLVALIAAWGVIAWREGPTWAARGPELPDHVTVPMPRYSSWQTIKGLAVAAGLMAVFILGGIPREIAALAGAGILLASRELHSRDMLGLVDWQLLVLFAGLFVVNHAFQQTHWPDTAVTAMANAGADPAHPGWLFAWTVVLSNLVSNVPAVMLLLPLAEHALAGPLLALASTFAGNLLIVGSIANIIVVDGAARQGIAIDWKRHARVGIPVTMVTLLVAALGLALS